MKTKTTCNTCIELLPLKDHKGNLTPDLCQIRANCPDDASTTEKRKEILYELHTPNQTEMEMKTNDQPTQHPTQTPRLISKHRNKPKNTTKHKTLVSSKKKL